VSVEVTGADGTTFEKEPGRVVQIFVVRIHVF
jgi:hypothetical protein